MTQLTLNLLQGSVGINFTPQAARDLQTEIAALMQSLKAVALTTAARGSRPQPQQSMEYRHQGDVALEVFCNPNIYPSPFSAKVLITIKDRSTRLTTEAELTQLLEDLDRYLDQ